MVGDTDNDRQTRRKRQSGHRAVPHTADVRVEAWGTTRESCLAEAALGLVECFADTSGARTSAVQRVQLPEGSDEELLIALLEEVIFWLEVPGRVPVEVEADATDGGLEVRAALTELADVEITGAAPKGVSYHEVRVGPDPYGWSCAATVDL